MGEMPFSKAFKGGKGGRQPAFETAAAIFAGKGYHQTTVDEVAQTIGVAKGTIYYHFKNKEELYLALLREGIDLFKRRLEEAVAGAAAPREKIKNIVASQLKFYEEEKDLVFLFLKELCGTDLRRETLAGMLSECLAIIRGAVEEGIEDGAFRAVDPEITTYSLFGMVTITALHYLTYSRPVPHAAVSRQVEQIFFEGTAGILPDEKL